MKPHVKKLKAELKALAETITNARKQFKEAQRAGTSIWASQAELSRARYDYRHKHIVRCLIRGTPREKIEQPKDQNKPNEKYIEKLLAEVLSEALCSNQGGSIEKSAGSAGGARSSGVLPAVSEQPMEPDASVPKMSDPRNAPGLFSKIRECLRDYEIPRT